MARWDEKEAAKEFKDKFLNGFYLYERSVNTEVNYGKYKEDRDKKSVKEYLNSQLFEIMKNTR